MKKIISLFAFTLMSSGASAVQTNFGAPPSIKISFSGKLHPSSGLDDFSGFFEFNPEQPVSSDWNPNNYLFEYTPRHTQFHTSSGSNINLSSTLYLGIDDDLPANKLTKYKPDLDSTKEYDLIRLFIYSDNASFSDETGKLNDGKELTVFAIYEKNTFDLPDTESVTPDLENFFSSIEPMKTTTPLYRGLNITQMNHGNIVSIKTGSVGAPNVSAVPLPAAFWLFTSAVAALRFRFRQRA